MEIKSAALIGMGAIGTVYGNLLYKSLGSNFAVIAGESRKEKLEREGFKLNGSRFYTRVLSPISKKEKFDLIIFSVKNYQLEEAIEDVRSFVGDKTILITILNGVTARDRISAAFPYNMVLYGLSIRIDAQRTSDGVINTVNGEIQFGAADNKILIPEVLAVKECFDKAGIQNAVFEDMIRTIWKKFMLNVGVNQITAITRAPYGKVTKVETNLVLFREAMGEVLTIARAMKIDLRQSDLEEFVGLMDNFSPNGKTSMLQDIEAKRRTEVDYFAGTVVEYGKKLSIDTPVNHVLYCIIKSIEALY